MGTRLLIWYLGYGWSFLLPCLSRKVLHKWMMQGAMFNLCKVTPYLKSFLTNLPPASFFFYPSVIIAHHSEINSINIFIMSLPTSLWLFTSRIQSFLLSFRFNFSFPSLAPNSFHPHTLLRARVCVSMCVYTKSQICLDWWTCCPYILDFL